MLGILAAVTIAGAAPAGPGDPRPAADVVVVARVPPDGMPAGARRVPDRELATMRGGMVLPNGFDVTIGIDVQTRVDGMLALHTVYTSSGPDAGVRLFRDGTAMPSPSPGSVTVSNPGGTGAPGIVVDRSPTGTTVWTVAPTPAATVTLTEAPVAVWPTAAGEIPVPVQANGAPVMEGGGAYTLTTGGTGFVAGFDAGSLQIQHLVGQATGAVVLNTANDRVIDSVTAVNIDLGGFPAAAISSALSMDTLALEVMRGR